ncbi:MAG: hypothetical protein HQL47_05445 [Gammaproteobacteria bacterium]|nr:hypothetical protein [Gammaproteobacteria bacterium]
MTEVEEQTLFIPWGNDPRETLAAWQDSPEKSTPPFVFVLEIIEHRLASIGEVATAIEQAGFYSWDRFGRFIYITASSDDADAKERYRQTLDDLAQYSINEALAWSEEPCEGPTIPAGLTLTGWPVDKLPDFISLETDRLQRETGRANPPPNPKGPAPQSSYREILRGLVLIHWPEAKEELGKPRTELVGKIHQALQRQGIDVSTKTLRAYLKD